MNTVKMKRNEPRYPGGPLEADVHPDAVSSWETKGWRLVSDTKAEKSVTADSEHYELVTAAADLKIAAPSTLQRWSNARLQSAIEAAQAEE